MLYIDLGVVFLASFLMDTDHYISAFLKTKKIDFMNNYNYHLKEGEKRMKKLSKGIREREPFHLFHTIEFHIVVAILGLFWNPFLFIFIGMVFHSLLDLGFMMYHDILFMREFFFFNWLAKKLG
ncbi:MAG: hypothetical protein AABW80_00535 [Nanoarchaeota archaeon]